ncbi:MAG: dTDP-4-dehydrorhamnose reductase [Limisphaerales bacterium]|nr:dTDP-4-dehydrorhamnose reductase [Verrucomicrobiota bacterium]
MAEKQILIIGKSGQVGYQLRRTIAPLGQITALEYPELDLCNPQSIRSTLSQLKPAVILNAAAYTAVDKAESDEEKATQLNAQAPEILAQYAKENDTLLVHYSTDYVFGGKGSRPYVETDKMAPLSVYGRTKAAADQAILNSGCKHLIFRLCWVYGARGQNFFLTMRKLAQDRDELRIVSDQWGSPTSARFIAEATALALIQVLQSNSPESYYGLYHLAGNGFTNWHQFAQKVIEAVPAEKRKCKMLTPITTQEYPTAAVRPAYSVMDCSKVQHVFGITPPHWEALLELVNEEAAKA